MSDLYNAKILADSLSPTDVRLTSFELTFPRFILPEFNTHRVFSRNSASSRAIPVWKQLVKVLEEPFVPEKFGRNKSGMQAEMWLSGEDAQEAKRIWLYSRDRAVYGAIQLLIGSHNTTKLFNNLPAETISESSEFKNLLIEKLKTSSLVPPGEKNVLNVHKQTANRLIEPYSWHTVLVTATEWDNFWALRDSDMAQPEIHHIATLARNLYDKNVAENVFYGEYHMPLLHPDEIDAAKENPLFWLKVVSGRCARVSYETHDGIRDTDKDIALYETLVNNGHMSPLEHSGTPLKPTLNGSRIIEKQSGNFRGWEQYRKRFANESNYGDVLKSIIA